jgi:uncharacterized protein YfiM (DUF2279 family)
MKQGIQGLWWKFEGLRLGFVLICMVHCCSPLFSQIDSVKSSHAPQVSKVELDSVSTIDLPKALQGKLNCPYGSTKDSTKNNPAPHLEGRMANYTIRNKQRIRLVTAGNIVGYGGAMVGLYSAWYKNYPQTSFHFFNDNKEWLQVDKVGHMYAAYIESKASMEMWRWAGLERKKRIWIGGLSGAAYQTVIEVLDGFSEGWGWSWGDFAANVAGSGLLIGQELAWDDQRIQFKFSFHKKNYGEAQLNQRADNLYGTSLAERMLKDYNGQTYWLSANLKSFFKQSNLPPWLNIAVGYGAEGMFGGTTNSWKDPVSGNNINRTDISRYRQWYIAPDVDLTKIKTKNKFLKTAFFVLNSFKFPAPSLGMSKKGVAINWFHF